MEALKKLLSLRGFTLVELIMVIVVIGILAAIVVPRFADQGDAAKISSTKANLESLRTAVEVYKANEGISPNTLQALTLAGPKTGNIYLRSIPREKITDSANEFNTFSGSGGWMYNWGLGTMGVNVSQAVCDTTLKNYCANQTPVENPQAW